MTSSWTLAVDRDDLSRTSLLETEVPRPADGEVVLRVDRVGVTANNVTYAVLGDAFRYWEFFPTLPGRGLVPLWGFAEVSASRVPGPAEGTRFYGCAGAPRTGAARASTTASRRPGRSSSRR
jgi:hypothetical protein